MNTEMMAVPNENVAMGSCWVSQETLLFFEEVMYEPQNATSHFCFVIKDQVPFLEVHFHPKQYIDLLDYVKHTCDEIKS